MHFHFDLCVRFPEEIGEPRNRPTEWMKLADLEVEVEEIFPNKPSVLANKPRIWNEDQPLHMIQPIL